MDAFFEQAFDLSGQVALVTSLSLNALFSSHRVTSEIATSPFCLRYLLIAFNILRSRMEKSCICSMSILSSSVGTIPTSSSSSSSRASLNTGRYPPCFVTSGGGFGFGCGFPRPPLAFWFPRWPPFFRFCNVAFSVSSFATLHSVFWESFFSHLPRFFQLRTVPSGTPSFLAMSDNFIPL